MLNTMRQDRGAGHLHKFIKRDKILARWRKLLHKMDGSQAPSSNHHTENPKIYMLKHHVLIRNPQLGCN
ncbi:hypothetical protein CR513_06563, partial [Mucuna pruriens]